jgi:hypothetical protein
MTYNEAIKLAELWAQTGVDNIRVNGWSAAQAAAQMSQAYSQLAMAIARGSAPVPYPGPR